MFASKQTSRHLALTGILGPIVWWLLIIVNGAITPGYSHVTEFISTLGAAGAPYAILQQINFAVLGGAVLALMLGIHNWFGDERRPRVGTVLLGVFGVGIILAGVFPENTADPDSTTNVLHTVTSVIAFFTGIAGIGFVTRRISADDRWPSYRHELPWTVVIMLSTFAVFIFSAISGSAFVGLTQRLFIGVMTLWVVMQSFRLYRLGAVFERSMAGEGRTETAEAKIAD